MPRLTLTSRLHRLMDVVTWSQFDNATGATTDLGITKASDPSIAAPAELPAAAGTYIRLAMSATGGPESWAESAHAYFCRQPDGWKLVGFERMPGGSAPGRKFAQSRR